MSDLARYEAAVAAVREMIDESPCDDDCVVSECPRIEASAALPVLDEMVQRVAELEGAVGRLFAERDSARADCEYLRGRTFAAEAARPHTAVELISYERRAVDAEARFARAELDATTLRAQLAASEERVAERDKMQRRCEKYMHHCAFFASALTEVHHPDRCLAKKGKCYACKQLESWRKLEPGTLVSTLRAQLAASKSRVRALVEALEGVLDLTKQAQELCCRSILPSSDNHALNSGRFQELMVDLLDGPGQRQRQDSANAALAAARTGGE